ncbi:carbon-nitrogen hydrolase family protein [Kordiimonas laminariae]|uniref:carbon-nitrogen hydrolase family protein n=1 Tax=Kordiimonas laminariae TaxID=2917717 RepID=UPI001FF5CF94|nr:carbon-nitrogen hydrolase family protein [Kordiimonas laminariae]
MTENPKLAIVQEAPVFLNLEASTEKAVKHIREAANQGANIISFAECWLPGYPVWLDFSPEAAIWDHAGAKALFRTLYENSVVRGDKHLKAIQDVCNETGSYIVIGTHERDGNTLYNTTFTFTPGAAEPVPHRKLVPTYTERLVWGRGDGSTMETVETPWGTLGSLICWEHWMPLARAAMHAKHETFHIAQWPIVKDMHQVASRHYAFEGRCTVAAAGSIMTRGDVIEGYKSLGNTNAEALAMLEAMPGKNSDFIHNGGSSIVAADGSYLADPLFDASGIVIAEVDTSLLKEQAQTLDTNGHYSRPDIFELSVNTRPMDGVKFEG